MINLILRILAGLMALIYLTGGLFSLYCFAYFVEAIGNGTDNYKVIWFSLLGAIFGFGTALLCANVAFRRRSSSANRW